MCRQSHRVASNPSHQSTWRLCRRTNHSAMALLFHAILAGTGSRSEPHSKRPLVLRAKAARSAGEGRSRQERLQHFRNCCRPKAHTQVAFSSPGSPATGLRRRGGSKSHLSLFSKSLHVFRKCSGSACATAGNICIMAHRVRPDGFPQMQREIKCMMMRGGTSKGAYFVASDLPADPAVRDPLLLSVMGSPDPAPDRRHRRRAPAHQQGGHRQPVNGS